MVWENRSFLTRCQERRIKEKGKKVKMNLFGRKEDKRRKGKEERQRKERKGRGKCQEEGERKWERKGRKESQGHWQRAVPVFRKHARDMGVGRGEA